MNITDELRKDLLKSLLRNNEVVSTLILDSDFNILGYSENFKKLVVGKEINKGDSFFELLYFYGKNVQEGIEHAFKGMSQEIIHTHDISNKFYETIVYPLSNEELEIYGAVLHTKDITNRQDCQNSLEQNETALMLLNSTAEGIYGVDSNNICTFVNKSFLKMFRFKTSQDVIGQDMHDLIHKFADDSVDQEQTGCPILKAIHEGVEIHIEEQKLFRADLTSFYSEYHANPQIHNGTIIGAVITINDITARIELRNSLKNSELRLQQAQEIGKVGSWEFLLDKNIMWASDQAYKIYGLTKEGEFFDREAIQRMAYIDERERLNKEFVDLVTNEKPYEITYRLNSGDGKVKYIYSNASLFKDASGKPEKIIGVIQDVTNSKQKEMELEFAANNDFLTGLYNRRHYEESLAKYDVPDNYPLTIVMADINGLKLINDAFGHKSGDKILVSAANIMSESCRENDLLARIGGDEFVLVLNNTDEIETEEIIKAINDKAQKIKIESIPLSISFGYKTKRNNNDNIQDIFRAAEDLMYREKLVEIPSMRSGAIETILTTLNEKDKYSEIHSRSVSNISEKIAKKYGLERQEISEIKTAGLLHDIGKIIIQESILKKEGKLTTEEYEIMKTHSEIGFRILNSISNMRNISNIVLNHHERWDGKGYPRGISSNEIPLQSRIIAIADSFDAMISERSYREILSKEEALAEIIKNSGTQFDPRLVAIFRSNFDDISSDI